MKPIIKNIIYVILLSIMFFAALRTIYNLHLACVKGDEDETIADYESGSKSHSNWPNVYPGTKAQEDRDFLSEFHAGVNWQEPTQLDRIELKINEIERRVKK